MQYENEIDLVLTCSKRDSSTKAAEKIRSLLTNDLDWGYLIVVCYRNGVAPLVFTNLLKAGSSALPESVRADLSTRLKQHTENNLFLTSQIVRIAKTFRAAGIPLLPFKGPLLSMQAYGNPVVRYYGDLDVLVQPKHLDDSIILLQKNGYQAVTKVSWLKKSNWYISRQKDVRFLDESGQTILELHWKLSGSHFGLPKEMNRLWDRLESISIGGISIANLDFNDLLIYLCLHGSRHSWERLAWICDVYYLLTSRDEIDWDTILAESKGLGCENVVALGLKLINEFFDYPIPEQFADSIRQNSVYDEMANEVRKRTFAPESVQVELGDRYAYHLKLKERRSDRWKLHVHYLGWYLRIIMKPNEVDRDVLHLPRVLFPLYYLTRPFRLARTYLFNHK